MAADPRATARVKKRKEEKLSLNKPKYKMGDNFDNTSNSSRVAAMADSSLFKPKKDKPKKPTYKSDDSFDNTSNNSRTAALDAALKKRKSSAKSITDEEMADIDRRIAAVIKARKKTDPKVEITDKEIEDIAKKTTGTGVVPKVKTKGKKRGLIFGKDAKFRPFGGVLARALLGDDEKFGGERGLIDFVRTKKKKPVKKMNGGEMTMQAEKYRRGGTVARSKPGNELPMVGKKPPMSRAQSRATLSPAQRKLLDSFQVKEGGKQSTSVIQDLSDKYGYKPGKRAGAKGGMGKGKRAKPPGMQMGGAVGMAPPGTTAQRLPPSGGPKAIDTAKLGALPPAQAQGGPGSARSLASLAAMTRGMNRGPNRPKPTKATAMRGAAARRSGGSTPRGMKDGGITSSKKSSRGTGCAQRGFGKALKGR